MKIVTVLMLATQDGSPDGFTVREYEKGETYDIPEDLAKSFVTDLEVAEPFDREAEAEAAAELEALEAKAALEAAEAAEAQAKLDAAKKPAGTKPNAPKK